MTYVASPRSAAEPGDRAEDCEQCLTSAFLHLTASSPGERDDVAIEAVLVTSAVQAGWAEQEVREAVSRLRGQHAERPLSDAGPALHNDPTLVPPSSP